jgi:hypothetical protein
MFLSTTSFTQLFIATAIIVYTISIRAICTFVVLAQLSPFLCKGHIRVSFHLWDIVFSSQSFSIILTIFSSKYCPPTFNISAAIPFSPGALLFLNLLISSLISSFFGASSWSSVIKLSSSSDYDVSSSPIQYTSPKYSGFCTFLALAVC